MCFMCLVKTGEDCAAFSQVDGSECPKCKKDGFKALYQRQHEPCQPTDEKTQDILDTMDEATKSVLKCLELEEMLESQG